MRENIHLNGKSTTMAEPNVLAGLNASQFGTRANPTSSDLHQTYISTEMSCVGLAVKYPLCPGLLLHAVVFLPARHSRFSDVMPRNIKPNY